MRSCTSVGINDDFSSSKSRITIGTTDNKAPGRVDIELIIITHPTVGKGVDNVRADYFTDPLL